MAFTIPDVEPTSIVAGVSWQWNKDLSDYKPDDGWTLIYYFVQAASSPADFSITTTNVSNVHNVDVEEAVTVLYTPDLYYYQGIVNNGTDTHLAVTGQMLIEQDFSDGSVTDPRSWSCQALDALESSIAGTADATQLSYVIDGIQVSEMGASSKLTWLEGLRRICASEKENEDLQNGRKTNRVGRISFTSV